MALAKLRGSTFNILKLTVSYSNVRIVWIHSPQSSGHRSGFFMCSLQLMTQVKLWGSTFNFLKLTVSYSNVRIVEIQRPQSSGHRSGFFMCSLQLMTQAKLRA